MKYSIPEINMESLEKKLIRIQNKCKKYGCEFKYERLGEHFEEKTFYAYDYDAVDAFGAPASKKWKEIVKYIDIAVEGTAAVNGWRYAASLEYTDKGNIIAGTGEIEIPEKYYHCAPWCEHCKTARDRRYSYIVFNEETGEFKQVGKSCLKDFTGGLSAEYVASYESFLKEIEEAREVVSFGDLGVKYFKVKEFMEAVAETIRLYGYCKRDGMNVSTADRAEEIYREANGMRITKAAYERVLDAKDRGLNLKNAESIELANMVREWILGNEREDNYFHNLKVACALEWGDYKVLGLLASAFPTYNRELEFEAEKRAREAAEKEAAARAAWMGKVGDKVSFKVADFKCISSWETQWGLTCVYKFVDENGLEATWKTNNWVNDRRIIGSVISGKVKELKEYRGIKQTELTRCKIEYKEEKIEPYNNEVEKAFEAFLEETA